jgi:methylmalonyl-CoA mutase
VVCQPVSDPVPAAAGRSIKMESTRGARAAWFHFDAAARHGVDADNPALGDGTIDGVVISHSGEFDPVLKVMDPTAFALHLDGGLNGIVTAAAWVAACGQRSVDPARLIGSFGWDPVGSAATDGAPTDVVDQSLALIPDFAVWCRQSAPHVRGLTASTIAYHSAGAGPTQELALAAATGVEYIRRMVDGGLSIDDAARQITFRVAVGRDLFVEIAKLRQLRRIWSRIVEACGGDADSQRALIHAVTSPRCLTQRDPWVNMLRTTVESFAAVAGDADIISIFSFDQALGQSDDLGRRMASNIHAIMAEESHLHRLVDPAGGSYYVEELGRHMAQDAWSHFQRIEASGGMATAIATGEIARSIAPVATAQDELIAHRRTPVTGVSSFPNLAEEPVERPLLLRAEMAARIAPELDDFRRTTDPASSLADITTAVEADGADGRIMEAAVAAFGAGATIAQVASALGIQSVGGGETALGAKREAADFERLRDASDRHQDSTGQRPRAFLANMGPIPKHRLRSDFARNLLEAGGIETVRNEGFETVSTAVTAFERSGTQTAVLCSSDDIYESSATEIARALKQAGAATVVLAGAPGERETEWTEAGIDLFVFAGCNAREVLADLLRREGVSHD